MLPAHRANREYFRRAYRTGVHGWAVDAPSPHAVGLLKRLKRLVPGGELLDLGCGEGRHAIAAARLGFKVQAIDCEPLALKRARHFARLRGVRGITFLKADVFRLPFAPARFDIVLDYGCLHHQKKSDWAAYKRSILRVLKPRAHYVLSVFSPHFRLFHGSRRPWHISEGAYRRCFRRRDIRELFGREFEIVELNEQRGALGGFWHVWMKRRSPPACS